MKEEVPPSLIDVHVKTVEEAKKEGKSVDPNFGLDKTGIAGTGPEEKEEGKTGKSLYTSSLNLLNITMPEVLDMDIPESYNEFCYNPFYLYSFQRRNTKMLPHMSGK